MGMTQFILEERHKAILGGSYCPSLDLRKAEARDNLNDSFTDAMDDYVVRADRLEDMTKTSTSLSGGDKARHEGGSCFEGYRPN